MGLFSKLSSFLERRPRGNAQVQAELNALRQSRVESDAARRAMERIEDEERKLKEIRVKKRAGRIFARIAEDEEKAAANRKLQAQRDLEDAMRRAEEEVNRKLGQTVEDAQWQPLTSSNVDRIRWGSGDRKLQIIYKDGSLYEYDDVEPEVYRGFLTTHSPGQYRWSVLGDPRSPEGPLYNYRKISGGHKTSAPAPDRFSGKPFAVPKHIENIQRKHGRHPEKGAVMSKPFAPPPG